MKLEEFKKNYMPRKLQSDHASLVKDLSLKLFNIALQFFPKAQEFNNSKDLYLLECGAYLHDIGAIFEKKLKKGHHKIGRDLILKNKISGLDDKANLVVANIVRYHRKSLPDGFKHKYYKMLTPDNKRKTNIFASIVRLADAVDYNHFNMVDNIEAQYDKKENILTLNLGVNIMLNVGYRDVLNEKKQFFEKTFNTEVLFK